MRDTSKDIFSICAICGDRITLRLPGSSVWKLDSTLYKDTAKHQHKTTFVFDYSFETRAVDRQATKIYWRDNHHKKKTDYRKTRNICIELACKELGFVTPTKKRKKL